MHRCIIFLSELAVCVCQRESTCWDEEISNHSAPKFVEADDAGVRFHTRLCGVGVEYNGEEEETVNNKMTVCEHCLTPVASSSGNTSNMTARLRRQRPAGSLSGSRTAEQVPPSSEKQQTLAAFHHAHLADSERGKKKQKNKGFAAVLGVWRCWLLSVLQSSRLHSRSLKWHAEELEMNWYGI